MKTLSQQDSVLNDENETLISAPGASMSHQQSSLFE